jgi:SAM-dependent methyltransferase
VAGGRNSKGTTDRPQSSERAEHRHNLPGRIDPEHPRAKPVNHRVTLDGTAETELHGLAEDLRNAGHTFTLAKVSTSLVYRSALGYELLMRVLYGRHYAERMGAVAGQVPDGASVLELCCGPGTLYRRYLRRSAGGYIGVDVNERFVEGLQRRGVDARRIDLADANQPLPAADVAIMQASLYHFLPDAAAILDRMLATARDRVIVSEPVRNLATSDLPGVALLGRRAADPGVGGHAERFTETTLDALMARYRERTLSAFSIPGGREKVYVLSAED